MSQKMKDEGIGHRIEIPEGCDIAVEGSRITARGPKGELSRTFRGPFVSSVRISKEGNAVVVRSASGRRKQKALAGTINSHIKNLLAGVSKGYAYRMKIFYTHFPITVEPKGGEVLIKNFLGERTSRVSRIIGASKVEVKKDEIIITGPDKEDVAQTAANIENACRLSRKDRRVFLDGIYITKKGD